MKHKILPLIYNLVFLDVFSKRKKGLAGLTNAILKTNIKAEDIKYKSTRKDKGIKLKTSELDIRFNILDEYSVNLEMQREKPNYQLENRLLYYLSHLIDESIPKGSKYEGRKCYVISILNFNMYRDRKCIREFYMKDAYGNEMEQGKIIIVELKKEKHCKDELLRKWMRLFVAEEFQEYEEDQEMKDVVDGILEANEDEELKELEFQKKVEHACQLEAIHLATQRGQNQIITTLYRKGKTKEEIAELTDIPLQQIEKILVH